MTTLQYLEVRIEPTAWVGRSYEHFRTLRINVKTQDGQEYHLEKALDVSDLEGVYDYIWRSCGEEIKRHMLAAERGETVTP